jgi:hypothetical protein
MRQGDPSDAVLLGSNMQQLLLVLVLLLLPWLLWNPPQRAAHPSKPPGPTPPIHTAHIHPLRAAAGQSSHGRFTHTCQTKLDTDTHSLLPSTLLVPLPH